MSVDRKALNVLLAVLDIEQQQLADMMGYQRGYIANILNGFTKASPAFRTAFGAAVTHLIFGPEKSGGNRLPAKPLAELLERRAECASNKNRFYEDLGLCRASWTDRVSVTEELVDRICCRLGVHPSQLYGRDYFSEVAS